MSLRRVCVFHPFMCSLLAVSQLWYINSPGPPCLQALPISPLCFFLHLTQGQHCAPGTMNRPYSQQSPPLHVLRLHKARQVSSPNLHSTEQSLCLTLLPRVDMRIISQIKYSKSVTIGITCSPSSRKVLANYSQTARDHRGPSTVPG